MDNLFFLSLEHLTPILQLDQIASTSILVSCHSSHLFSKINLVFFMSNYN
uniref:Uncharacterized protein n=1 Tax=Rhizophora mucronata TaxID=61149 RepID=A0A2P2NAK5_RHIMU